MNNVVYIFGAGASKDFGLPLGDEIFDYAHALLSTTLSAVSSQLKAAIEDVQTHLKDIYAMSPFGTAKFPTFEEVLTFVWDCKRFEKFDYDKDMLISPFKTSRGADDVFHSLVRMLGLTLSASMERNGRQRLDAFKAFIKTLLARGDNVSFISMNYDIILDRILSECVDDGLISDFTYGIPLYRMSGHYNLDGPSQSDSCRKDGILLLKPHGSLNLICCTFHRQCDYGWGFYYSPDEVIIAKHATLKCPTCGHRALPLIIPPLYNKASYIESFKDPPHTPLRWRSNPLWFRKNVDPKITKVLRAADEVVIVGYSMPVYDYDFKTLVLTSLMQNKRRGSMRLRIITKGNKKDKAGLRAHYQCLVAEPIVESANGFYEYLTTCVR
jgi:hypothetical protein